MEGNISVISFCIYVPKVVFISNIQFPYTPQQHAVAEKKNRSLKEMTTCMLEAKKLAANLWAEAMNAAIYIQNRVPHSSVKGKTPFKSYFGHKPDVSKLRVFGSQHGPEFRLIKGGICNRKE